MNTAIETKKPPEQAFAEVVGGKKLSNVLALVLPKHLDVERFKRHVLDSAVELPALMQCSPASVYKSVVRAAELGLELGGALGHAYLIPYKSRCELVIGYKGFLELAGRSSRVRQITAGVVYQAELDAGLFRFQRAPFALVHGSGKPGLLGGELVYAYAMAELVTGGYVGVVLERSEVMARKPANVRPDSPWNTREDRMWRKSAVRALLAGGTVPLSPRLQAAMKYNDPEILDAEVIRDDDAFEPMADAEIEEIAGEGVPRG